MPTPRSLVVVASAAMLSSPYFGVSPAAAGTDQRIALDQNPGATPIDPATLYLRAGEFHLPEHRAGLDKLVTPAGDPAPVHYVIQLDGPITPAWRHALTTAGVRVLDYLPSNAFVARLDGADAARVAALGFVRWHGPFDPAWKVDPEVTKREFITQDRRDLAAAGRSRLAITLFDLQRPGPVAEFIRSLKGAEVLDAVEIDGNPTLDVTISTADIPRIAALDAVQFIEEAPEVTLRSNSNNRWVVQTNQPNVTPFYDAGIRGEGQVVGIIDSRVHTAHCSFTDAAPIGPAHRKILALNASSGSAGSHGTHVAGTVVGDSGVDNDLRGVAYMGKLVHNIIPSPLGSNHPTVFNSLNQHHDQGARVHTNSWGNDGTTSYDTLCRVFDEFLWLNEDSMVTLAVTNGSSLKNPENAKNLLACGATDPVPGQAQHCTGGTGPTSDQRRKPELYAPGCSTISASISTCGTASSSGTSMATPAIAGAAMLARQYFTDGYYPSGVANPSDAFIPSGALVKATLLNSSVDMTGPAGFPSNQEGWGRVLLDNALFLPGDTRRTIVHDLRNADGLSTDGVSETTINVLSSSQPLSITLAWTEPPAAAGAALATINNLDLIVTAPDGAVYRGNVFSGGQSATGGSSDLRNNVEQVRLTAPTPGAWTVRVEGAAVNQSSQGFAMVASGDVQGGPAGLHLALASPAPTLVPPGTPQTIDVTINPGDDSIVPGTATLSYRFADGPFTAVPLAHVEDGLYRATIPAASCGQTPEFFVAVEGVDSGPRTAPPSAPAATYAYEVGTIVENVILSENLDALPAGWSVSGLWHIQTSCAVLPLCDGPSWLGYSQDSTCTYNTGGANSGAVTLPPISLPPVPAEGSITLAYCSTMQSENNGNFDRGRVFVNGTQVDQADESPSSWQERSVNLTGFAGQEVTITFEFATVDSQFNSFRGWQVDNIRINAATAACTGSCPADANGDGQVNSGDISAFLTTWLGSVSEGNLEGDFNGDQAVNSGDISAFLTAWLDAVSNGC